MPSCHTLRNSLIFRRSPSLRLGATLGLALTALPLCGANPPTSAGEAAPTLTLRDLVQRAYERSPERQVLTARGGRARALEERSKSLIAGVPEFEAAHLNDAPAGNEGQREWDAGFRLPLWRLGQRSAAGAVAQTAETGVAQSDAALRLTVAGQVREAVWNLAQLRNSLELARQEWETAQALEKDVTRRVELGEMARTDLMIARDETLRQRTLYLRAQSELQRGMEEYESLTGLEQLPARTDEVLAEGRAVPDEHPLLGEARANVEQAQARARAVRKERGGSPELWLGAHSERGDSRSDYNSSLALALKLPIGTAAHTAVPVAEAELELTQTLAELDALRRRLKLDLAKAHHELESTREQLGLAREQHRLGQESLRLARVAFALGETDLTGLLRVQARAFAAARAEQELSISEQRAIARYNQSLGVLP